MGHRLSCFEACEIFPDQGLNLCLLHSQVDYLPLSHQGNPREVLKGPRLLAGFSFPGPGLRVQGNLMALASEDGSLCLPS